MSLQHRQFRLLLQLLFAICCLTAAQAQLGPVNASLIVNNVTGDCPVPNQEWPPEQFSVSTLVTTLAPLVTSGPRTNCTTLAQGLGPCAFDGSFGIKNGCCSSDCATRMQGFLGQNCLPELTGLGCNATEEQFAGIQSFVPVLLSAGQRCAGYDPPPEVICPNNATRVIPIAVLLDAAAGAPAAEGPMPELAPTAELGVGAAAPALPAVAAVPAVPAAAVAPAAEPGLAAAPTAEPAAASVAPTLSGVVPAADPTNETATATGL